MTSLEARVREIVAEAKATTILMRLVGDLQVARQLEVLERASRQGPRAVLALVDEWAQPEGRALLRRVGELVRRPPKSRERKVLDVLDGALGDLGARR